jgi:hypothetical protein
MSFKNYLLFFAACCFYKTTYAQWTDDSLQNTIVSDIAGTEQVTPLLASRTDGSTYISWFDATSGSYQLRMQLLDVNGNKLWGNDGVLVSDYPQSSALFRYDLKTDLEGNAVVAFQDTRLGTLNIVAYKLDSTGNFVWSADGISLTDSLAQEGLSPSIGVTGNNNVIIGWNSDSPSNKWISYQKISADGSLPWDSLQRIKFTNNSKKYSRPSFLPAGTDDFLMLYVQEVGNFPGVTSTIFTQLFDADGNGVWTSPVQFSSKTIPFFFFPAPVSDGNDGFYLAFNTSNPLNATLNDVYVQHIDNAGNLWSASGTEAANSTINHKTTPASCFDFANNEFWTLLQVLDGSQGSSGISIQKFDAIGNVLLGSNANEIYPISADYYLPNSIAATGDGVIIIYTLGPYGAQKIYGTRVDEQGSFVWANGSVMMCGVNSNKDDVASGYFLNDEVVIVWSDDRLDFSGVYAQNINADGTVGFVATDVADVSSEDHLMLYPNPSVTTRIVFQNENSSDATIRIFDASGKTVIKRNYNTAGITNEITIDEPELQAGIYFVQVTTSSYKNILKWVKQ